MKIPGSPRHRPTTTLHWMLFPIGMVIFVMTLPILPHQKTVSRLDALADTLLIDSLAGWPRPRFEAKKRERLRMVATQMTGIRDDRVLDAMRQVPRHLFVPEMVRAYAYEDGPLPIGEGQTISQPFIVAAMTEAADIHAGDKVLEVGTGSGYQAAVLYELTPEVYTIEIVESLAERAAATLQELGYSTVHTRIGDGYAGWPEAAPFDAIVVTAAPEQIPEALVEQLAPGGRMVIPVGDIRKGQYLIRLIKRKDGTVVQDTLFRVRFVPMIHGK